MSLFVLDTDLLTLYDRGDPIVVRSVDARPATDLAISALTVDKQLTGWYTLTRQARRTEEIARANAHLGDAVVRLARWRILPYTESAIARVAQLKVLRLNVRLVRPAHRRHPLGDRRCGRRPQPARLRPRPRPES